MNDKPPVQPISYQAQVVGKTVLFLAPFYGMMAWQHYAEIEPGEESKDDVEYKAVTVHLATGQSVDLDAEDSAEFLKWWDELVDPPRIERPAVIPPKAHNYR